MNDSAGKFYEYASVALSVMAGILISAPISQQMVSSSSNPSLFTLAPVFTFGILGFVLGLKRCKSRAFFYTSLLAVLVLTSLFGFGVFLR